MEGQIKNVNEKWRVEKNIYYIYCACPEVEICGAFVVNRFLTSYPIPSYMPGSSHLLLKRVGIHVNEIFSKS